jgi:hypothetical protein
MLGHSHIQMVPRYAHPTQQHQAQAMQRLEQFVTEERIAAIGEEYLGNLAAHTVGG